MGSILISHVSMISVYGNLSRTSREVQKRGSVYVEDEKTCKRGGADSRLKAREIN